MENRIEPLPAGPGLLADCWHDFRHLAWRWHFLALASLVILLAWRWGPVLRSPVPRVDEVWYEKAFANVAEGRSPYDISGYYYPPAFAFAGAACQAHLGEFRTRLLFRWLSVAGAALTCWLASAWWWSSGRSTPSRVSERLAVALILMFGAPGVGAGMETGNFGLAAASWINSALYAVQSWPILAGAILGLSLITKPLAAIAVAVLAGAASVHPAGRKVSPVTLAIAVAIGAGALLALPYTREFLRIRASEGVVDGTISLMRIARLAGVEVRHVVLLALFAPFAFFAGRRFATDRVALVCVALTLVLLTSPVIWPHTAVLFFPVPVMAMSVARARHSVRRQEPGLARAARFELLAVGALATAVLFLSGGAFDLLDPRLQILMVLAELAAPLLLGGYVLLSSASWRWTGAQASGPAPDRLTP